MKYFILSKGWYKIIIQFLSSWTGDIPLAKAHGQSPHTGGQTVLLLLQIVTYRFRRNGKCYAFAPLNYIRWERHREKNICNSYTTVCPPLREDSPRAVGGDNPRNVATNRGITILYHSHHCRPCSV